jgi:hypothetical protein
VTDELAGLHERVMRNLPAVPWPETRQIRARARRRRIRRIVLIPVVIVLTALAVAWTANPTLMRGDPQPAERPPGWKHHASDRPAPELLRPSDFGPNYAVSTWSFHDSGEEIARWPFRLIDCPAHQSRQPEAYLQHEGAAGARAHPSGSAPGPIVEEYLLRFPDAAAAEEVMAEARQAIRACAAYTVDDRVRYTTGETAAGFAGDDAVQVRTTEEAYDATTGRPLAPAAVHTYG